MGIKLRFLADSMGVGMPLECCPAGGTDDIRQPGSMSAARSSEGKDGDNPYLAFAFLRPLKNEMSGT